MKTEEAPAFASVFNQIAIAENQPKRQVKPTAASMTLSYIRTVVLMSQLKPRVEPAEKVTEPEKPSLFIQPDELIVTDEKMHNNEKAYRLFLSGMPKEEIISKLNMTKPAVNKAVWLYEKGHRTL